MGQGFDLVTGAGLEAVCDLDSRQEFGSITEDDEQKQNVYRVLISLNL